MTDKRQAAACDTKGHDVGIERILVSSVVSRRFHICASDKWRDCPYAKSLETTPRPHGYPLMLHECTYRWGFDAYQTGLGR